MTTPEYESFHNALNVFGIKVFSIYAEDYSDLPDNRPGLQFAFRDSESAMKFLNIISYKSLNLSNIVHDYNMNDRDDNNYNLRYQCYTDVGDIRPSNEDKITPDFSIHVNLWFDLELENEIISIFV